MPSWTYSFATSSPTASSERRLHLFAREYLPSAVAPDVLEANERSAAEQLAGTRMMDRSGVPTNLGILTLAKDPREFIPGDYIQFLRIDGKQIGEPIRDQKEIDGPVSELLRRLDDVLEANISVAADLSGAVEEQRPDYPLAALQQLARNAVLHRTYEGTNAPVRISWFADRIEIQSPGGPYGQVTRDTFGRPGLTDYRNPHLAEAMKVLGYVQRFGAGIPIARRELERNENPAPDFQVEDNQILVTVRRRP